MIDIKLEKDSNENADNIIKKINSEYTIVSNCLKIGQYQDKNILNDCECKNFKSLLEEIKIKLEQPTNNINDITLFTSKYPKHTEHISKSILISFKKIIERPKNLQII